MFASFVTLLWYLVFSPSFLSFQPFIFLFYFFICFISTFHFPLFILCGIVSILVYFFNIYGEIVISSE
jgi:hypothetical protein